MARLGSSRVNAGSTISQHFEVEPSGLALTSRVASGGLSTISVTVHDNGVYVLNAGGDGSISGFTVGNSGALTSIAGRLLAVRKARGSRPGLLQLQWSLADRDREGDQTSRRLAFARTAAHRRRTDGRIRGRQAAVAGFLLSGIAASCSCLRAAGSACLALLPLAHQFSTAYDWGASQPCCRFGAGSCRLNRPRSSGGDMGTVLQCRGKLHTLRPGGRWPSPVLLGSVGPTFRLLVKCAC